MEETLWKMKIERILDIPRKLTSDEEQELAQALDETIQEKFDIFFNKENETRTDLH